MSILSQIRALTAQLYPTGRAFGVRGWLGGLHDALSLSEAQAYSDALGILDSILPDNPNFTAQDATDWERRLGLITNTSALLSTRMALIQRRMNHPGTIKARQHYLYVQGQLQAGGFPVYVYENRFPVGGGYVTEDPAVVAGGGGVVLNQLDLHQLGDAQLGGAWGALIANSIYAGVDASFDVGADQRSTFFIGGYPIGTYANIPAASEQAFRQLVLQLKPAQTVAYLFINYV